MICHVISDLPVSATVSARSPRADGVLSRRLLIIKPLLLPRETKLTVEFFRRGPDPTVHKDGTRHREEEDASIVATVAQKSSYPRGGNIFRKRPV